MKTKIVGLFLICMAPLLLCSQTFDYGDAPEGVLAYPNTSIIGQFPTCKTIGPSGWVQHANFGAFFLSAFDQEADGNAGFCPAFPSYDMDECFNDGDAGLVIPQPFTIVNGQVLPCPASTGTSLGGTCQTITWGPDIDIRVINLMPNNAIGFVNVIIDWNQNGGWGDITTCPQGTVPEHVTFNFPVPNGFSGLLSLLGPASFTSGPTTGFFWARFTISEKPVQNNWPGDGTFEDGESEDYLLQLSDSVIRINEIPDFGMIPLKVSPNPLEQNSSIEFILLQEGKVKVEIVDMQGKTVETIEEQQMSRGRQIIQLNEFPENGISLRNGIYLIRVFFNDRFAGFAKAVVVKQ
jgi:hypothetical protein